MKKICVLVLSLMVLLSGCGAVSESDAGISVGMSDLAVAVAEQIGVDLQGVSAALEVARDDTAAGLCLHFDKDGETFARLVLTADDTQAALMMESADAAPIYVVEDGTFGPVLIQLAEELMGVPAALGQVDWEQALQSDDELSQLLNGCYVPGGPMEYDGQTYDSVAIQVDNDTLLRLAELAGSGQQLEQLLTDNGLTVTVDGVAGNNDASAVFQLNVTVDTQEGSAFLCETAILVDKQSGHTDLALGLTMDGQDLFTGLMGLDCTAVESAPWLHMDTTGATVVSEQTAMDVLDLLLEDGASFLGGVMGRIAGTAAVNALAQSAG